MIYYEENYKEEFLQAINTPLGISVQEKLAAMHGYDLSLIPEGFEVANVDTQSILDIKIYIEGEEILRVSYFFI